MDSTTIKNNWERGIFEKHYLEHDDPMECEHINANVKVYPSEEPIKSHYYPLLMRKKGSQDNYGFYVVCIDADLKMSRELLFTSNTTHIMSCVMRDFVVWIIDSKVQVFDARCRLDERFVTIGTIKESRREDPDRNEYPRFLAMDDKYIVARTDVCVTAWCIKTPKFKQVLKHRAPPKSSLFCSYVDGSLAISTTPSHKNSWIEIFNMENFHAKLQRKLEVDGKVTNLKCDENSIAYTYENPANHIVVLDRKTYAVRFSHSLYRSFDLYDIFDELIIFRHFFKNYALNFMRREFYKCEQSSSQLLFTGFNNLALSSYEDEDYTSTTVDVWDWKRNVKLHGLTGDNAREKLQVMSVSESMVMTIQSKTGNFIVYKFA